MEAWKMIRRILLAVAVLSATLPLQAQLREDAYAGLGDSETVAAFKQHVGMIASAMMEGRKAGSDGERMTAEYLTETLKDYGVDILSGPSGDVFGLRQENGDTLTSRNVLGFIQGTDKTLRDHYIVVGARMDNLGVGSMTVDGRRVDRIFYGANGNASGLAMLMELGRMLATGHLLLGRSVLLVGFGASAESFAGAWYFLNRSFSDVPLIDAMIDLDMLGTGTNGFYAYTSSNADMSLILENLSGRLLPVHPQVTAQEPYPSDHRAFYAKEIPSVLFSSGRFPEYGTERDTPSILDYEAMERELEYIYACAVALTTSPRPVFNPSDPKARSGGRVAYYECDVPPTFLGSSDPRVFLRKWVYSYMKYPKEAVRDGIQGRVLVNFTIDAKGKVKDVKVVRSVDPLLDAEAVRVVSASPDWKPGVLDGKKVECELSLYIEFKLEKKGSFGIKKHER